MTNRISCGISDTVEFWLKTLAHIISKYYYSHIRCLCCA